VSQRELAAACGVAQAVVARAESGRRTVPVDVLVRAAGLAGLRLVLVDADGRVSVPMSSRAVRDAVGRLYPAHLDVRYGDMGWWHGVERYSRQQPWYTFDRDRYRRDVFRGRSGTPEDHQLPQPGDSPAERRAAWEHERWLARQAWLEERLRTGPRPVWPEPEPCTCPPACDDELDRRNRHVDACPCRCDID
jgi:transcriptional regulator with XRE-family HTH domain